MTDRIEPALTAEEWSRVGTEAARCIAAEALEAEVGIGSFPAIIAIANAALKPDDKRKITRETIAGIRETALLAKDALAREYGHEVEFSNGAMRERWGNVPKALLAMVERTAAFADALESYLPPEGT